MKTPLIFTASLGRRVCQFVRMEAGEVGHSPDPGAVQFTAQLTYNSAADWDMSQSAITDL